ncbi:MAG: S9 family peptidase [Algicola sp.]|nr:S9 family peptidase [Algicola sp.]
MRKITYILLLLLSFQASSNQLIQSESVSKSKNCFRGPFADYSSWVGFMSTKFKRRFKSDEKVQTEITRFKSTFNEKDFNTYKANLACNMFTYKVNGHPVRGYVIKPKGTDKKVPVLIYNRGGNGNFGAVVFGSMMNSLFPIADKGFAIIGTQYRGTFNSKATLEDEFGGRDVEDVTALLDIIGHIKGIEQNKIGMFGASRGGMQTFLALKQSDSIKAVATIAGMSNLLKGLEYRPEMEHVYIHRIPNYLKNKEKELASRSVLSWVDKLSKDVPILLIHGTNDKMVSVKHSIALAKALKEHKINHKIVLYEKDDHDLTTNQKKAHNEIVNWFNKHL